VACAQATSLNLFARGLLANNMAGLPPTIKGFTAAELYGNIEVSESDSLLRNSEIPCIEFSSQLETEETSEDPQDSQELPSKGSELHFSGKCEPCIFFMRKKCVAGAECQYCHFPRHDQGGSKKETDGTGSTGGSESTMSTSSKKDILRL